MSDSNTITERKAGRLNVKVYQTRELMGNSAALQAASLITGEIIKKGTCTVVFAAAPSQNDFFSHLRNADIDWSKVTAFHMDEYIGLDKNAPQLFSNFLKNAIFDHVPFKQVHIINGNAIVDQEIERYSTLLRQNPPDIVFMGIGENAHIAFNDPHVAHFDDEMLLRKVTLDNRCRTQQVNDGCFEKLDDVPLTALTLTIPALFSAPVILCIVPGANKAKAVRDSVEGEIRETVPASILRMHSNATLYADKDSAEFLL